MAMDAKERALFQRAMETIKSQQTQLEDLTAPVYPVGTLVAVFDKSVVVDMGNAQFECERNNGTDSSWIGSTVQVHPKTGQIVKRSPFVRYGQTGSVTQIDGKTLVITTPLSGTITTEYTQVPIEDLNLGDHVVLNSTNVVVMRKIDLKSKYAITNIQSALSWDDIGGCTDAKAELRRALELPYQKADVFNFFHKKRIKGAVLWGRPGNGKTLIGRACAGAIARVHNAESVETGFIYVKGPEVLSQWVGVAEEAIRTLFDHARLHFKRHGYPAIIFIDEADSLLTRRGTRTAAGMEQTIVPQFNAEMDGMEDSGAFVLLATNRVDILDPAITRPGRCDRKFYIGPPTLETAPEVLNIHMRNVPIAKQFSKDELIEKVTAAFFSQNYPLYKLEVEKDGEKSNRAFGLGNLASGAMIAGLVERATSYAIDRNLDNPKPDGLTLEDFTTALDALHKEQFGLNHYDELKEFVEIEKLEVLGIAPCHSAAEINTPIPKKPESGPKVVAVAAVPVGGSPVTSTINKAKKGDYDA